MTNCINLKCRSKHYQKYFICTLSKEINPICKGCLNKRYKEVKPMKQNKPLKQRTYKQAKIEKERYSIFTKDLTKCIECGKPKQDLHEIYRGSKRHLSIKYGLVLPLCRKCHEDREVTSKWLKIGQEGFMKYYKKTVDEFVEVFKKNYLE